MERKRLDKRLILISGVTALFCLAVVLDLSPYLRGPAEWPPEWRWWYLYRDTIGKGLLFVIATIALVLISLIFTRYLSRAGMLRELLGLMSLIVCGCLFSLGVFMMDYDHLYPYRENMHIIMVQRVVSHTFTSYFEVARRIHHASKVLAEYHNLMPKMALHTQTHPPGGVLYYYAIIQFFNHHPKLNHAVISWMRRNDVPAERLSATPPLRSYHLSAALGGGYLTMLLGCLAAIPVYLVSRLHFSARASNIVAIGYILLGTRSLITPDMDHVYPLFLYTSFWLYCRGLNKRRLVFAPIAGIIFYTSLFFSFGMLYFLLPMALYSGQAYLRAIKDVNRAEKIAYARFFISFAALFCLGFAGVYLLVQTATGLDLIEVFRVAHRIHLDRFTLNRSYWLWVPYNLYDFFVLAGLPLSLLYLSQLKDEISKLRYSLVESLNLFFWITLLSLIAMTLSGSVRGETGRIWFFMMPLILLSLGERFEVLAQKRWSLVMLILLQAGYILCIRQFWVTIT